MFLVRRKILAEHEGWRAEAVGARQNDRECRIVLRPDHKRYARFNDTSLLGCDGLDVRPEKFEMIEPDRLNDGHGGLVDDVRRVIFAAETDFEHDGIGYSVAAEAVFETFNPGAPNTAWACFSSDGRVRIVKDRNCLILPRTGG